MEEQVKVDLYHSSFNMKTEEDMCTDDPLEIDIVAEIEYGSYVENIKQENSDGSDFASDMTSPSFEFVACDYTPTQPCCNTGGQSLQCAVCEFRCERKKCLRRHIYDSHNTNTTDLFPCDCGFLFTSVEYLNRHKKHWGHKSRREIQSAGRTGSRVEEQQLKSAVCGNSDLKGVKPLACPTCPYRCARPCDLKEHGLTHSDEKPYACTICEYRCKSHRSLNVHKLAHAGEKPYSCRLCAFRCRQRNSLQRHVLTHTGERPYACSVCTYRCTQLYQLKKHTLTHRGEKLYTCGVCQYGYTRESHLQKHMLTHRAEEVRI